MTDQNALMRSRPLTAEEQAMLDRDAITESLGPFDFMPGGMTAAFGAGGTLIGGLLPGGIRSIPKMIRSNRRWGESAPVMDAVKSGLAQTGVVGGGSAGAGYVRELMDRAMNREQLERQMMFGNPADAEGQLGGFYGQPINKLMRR